MAVGLNIAQWALKSSGHYFKNDFARWCPFINWDGHKIQLPRKMPKDFPRRMFYLRRRSQLTASQNAFTEAVILFDEAVKNVHLSKLFMEAGIYKATASINQAQPANPRKPSTFSTI